MIDFIGAATFAAEHPFALGAVTGATGLGIAAANQQRTIDVQNSDLEMPDRAARAGLRFAQVAGTIGAGAGVTYAGYRLTRRASEDYIDYLSRVGQRAAGTAYRPFGRVAGGVAGRYDTLARYSATLPAAERMSGPGMALRAFTSHAGAMGLTGALIGAAYGATNEDVGMAKGAIYGAGIGIAAKVASGVPYVWSRLSKVPGARSVALAAAAGATFIGVRALREPEYQAVAYAQPNLAGGFDLEAAPPTSMTALELSDIQERMRTINATGDIAFGLHSARHG